MKLRILCIVWLGVLSLPVFAQQNRTASASSARQPTPFRWVNPPKTELPGVRHATFPSQSMGRDVGYCIYLPPAYRAENETRYPVVYYLHGGRPGSETKGIQLVSMIDHAISQGRVPSAIYVFVNGGPVSHYNYPEIPDAMGEDVFIKELIPHIDATYRTIADRSGRAVEGFSQGGRGTARIMFKHPHLFCSAAPGGGGHATEKRISESDGRESDKLRFAAGYNTWDLARKYAQQSELTPKSKRPLRILVYFGDKDFNYQANLDWTEHLESRNIEHERLIVEGVPHSAKAVYEQVGEEIMNFHAKSFRLATDE